MPPQESRASFNGFLTKMAFGTLALIMAGVPMALVPQLYVMDVTPKVLLRTVKNSSSLSR